MAYNEYELGRVIEDLEDTAKNLDEKVKHESMAKDCIIQAAMWLNRLRDELNDY